MKTPTKKLDIPLLSQVDGITCGPTCVAMVHQGFMNRERYGRELSIAGYRDIAGCNTKVGTTEVQMSRLLTALEVQHERSLGDADSCKKVHDYIASGRGFAALRTSTHGCKHWILATGVQGNNVLINDPAGGTYSLTPQQLDGRLRPRGWDWYMIPVEQTPPIVIWREITTLPDAYKEQVQDLLSEQGVLPFPDRFKTERGHDGSHALIMNKTLVAVSLSEHDPVGPYAVVKESHRGLGFGRMTLIHSGAKPAPGTSPAAGAVAVRPQPKATPAAVKKNPNQKDMGDILEDIYTISKM